MRFFIWLFGEFRILYKCLTLMCGYKMGDVSPSACSTKLKIIYRLKKTKTSKTADLDTISIQISISTCIMYMVGGYPRGGAPSSPPPPPPPPNETMKIANHWLKFAWQSTITNLKLNMSKKGDTRVGVGRPTPCGKSM